MRVLWFTNVPLDPVNRHLDRPTTGSGFWMHAMVDPLVNSGEIELAVVTAVAGDPAYRFQDGAVEYFGIPQQKVLEVFDVLPRFRVARQLRHATKIVDTWKPDIIHVHGTERFFGLVRARGLTQVPTVVSIQGLVGQIAQWAWGTMGWRDAIASTTLWDLTRHATLPATGRRQRRRGALEREILRGIDAVIGRTEWDHAHLRAMNPTLPYFHVDEMIRPAFWSNEPWSLRGVRRGTLLTTSSDAPIKGLPVLLNAVSILRRWGHDVRLKIAGLSRQANHTGTARHIFKLIDALQIRDRVDLLGWTDGEALSRQMRESHCFVSASFIENSSNAICEAQLLGMPCVATHTGGLTTLIADERTGLLFSRGDEPMLARQIERILLDDALATRLGKSAHNEARRRHDPQTIINDLLSAYRNVLGASPARDRVPTPPEPPAALAGDSG